jgi:small-conductance mechanosensitive channel
MTATTATVALSSYAITAKDVGSAAIVVAVLLAIVAVYQGGSYVKDHLDEAAAEAVQAFVVTVLGTVAVALLVDRHGLEGEVQSALSEAVLLDAQTTVKVMVSLLVLAGAYTVTRLAKRFVRFGRDRDHLTRHQQEVLHHLVQILVYLPAILFVFALAGPDPTDVLLSAGVLGVIIGFAARQTLSSVLAGFVLLFSRPFEVGDWVVLGDQEGVVRDITIVNTRIRTFDNEVVIVPNDEVTSEHIVNRSKNGRLRLRTEVGVDYDAAAAEAAETAGEAMAGLDVLSDVRDPDVVLKRFGDSSVVLELRYWIDDPTIRKKWRAQTEVMDAVKAAFEERGFKIPYPQRELTGREEAGGLQVAAAREAAMRDDGPEATDGGDGRASTDDDADPEGARGPAEGGE